MNDEVRRRRILAFGALGTGFALFLIAVILAVAGSGGDGGAPATTPTTAKRAKKPGRPADPGFPAVPGNAPGAHRAPNEKVPILVYDVINAPRSDTANPEDWVPPEEFTAQMDYLQQQGFHPVTLRQVWAAWKENGLLPSKPIVISFDTGYHSVYANALPTLRDRKWPGTLFLQPSQTEADFPATEVKALQQAGWEIDAQGQTGADPNDLTDEQLATEVTQGRQTVRRDFGARADFFSYPAGQFDQRVTQAVQSAGYLGAATLEEGLAAPDEPFRLGRIPVHNGDGEQGLADSLSSAGIS